MTGVDSRCLLFPLSGERKNTEMVRQINKKSCLKAIRPWVIFTRRLMLKYIRISGGGEPVEKIIEVNKIKSE